MKEIPEDLKSHLRTLGIAHIVYSSLLLVPGLIIFTILSGAGLLSGEWEAIAITSAISIFVTGLILFLTIPGIIAGIGLLQGRNWALILGLIIGILNLLSFPFGTALGVYNIWVFTKINQLNS